MCAYLSARIKKNFPQSSRIFFPWISAFSSYIYAPFSQTDCSDIPEVWPNQITVRVSYSVIFFFLVLDLAVQSLIARRYTTFPVPHDLTKQFVTGVEQIWNRLKFTHACTQRSPVLELLFKSRQQLPCLTHCIRLLSEHCCGHSN